MIHMLRNVARELREDIRGYLSPQVMASAHGVLMGVDRAYMKWLRRRMHFEWEQFAGPDWEWFTHDPPRPSGWSDYCRARGLSAESSPIYILVALRDPEALFQGEIPRNIRGYPVFYQYRRTCLGLGLLSELTRVFSGRWRVAKHEPGVVSVGAADPPTAGSLGGLITCQRTGKCLGIGCQHVLGSEGTRVLSPSPSEWRKSTCVGRVIWSEVPTKLPDGQRVDPRQLQQAGKLDVAVLDIDNPFARQIGEKLGNAPVGWNPISTMRLHAPVTFTGKVSGRQSARITHLCIWQEVNVAGAMRCFEDIFEIAHLQQQYVMSPIARPGDSGAWVHSRNHGDTLWDGLLFAGDGERAFCCFSENIVGGVSAAIPSLDLSMHQWPQ